MKSICPNCCGARVEFFDSSDANDEQNCIPCRLCKGEGHVILKEGETASEVFTEWEKTHFTHCVASFV